MLQVKRGNAENFPSIALAAGEPAFVLDTGEFFIGNGTEKIHINPPSSLPNTGTPGTYTKVTTDSKGRVTAATQITAADIPNLTLAKITDAGTVASKNTGVAVGNVPVVGANGKLDVGIMPTTVISDTFVVATQVAMLALIVEVGDIAVRTDLNKTFILRVAGASVLANWQELLTPTAAVQSVAGKIGAVTLAKGDVGLGSIENYGIATKIQAETGSANNVYMTPLRVAEAIASSNIDGGTF